MEASRLTGVKTDRTLIVQNDVDAQNQLINEYEKALERVIMENHNPTTTFYFEKSIKKMIGSAKSKVQRMMYKRPESEGLTFNYATLHDYMKQIGG